MCSLWGTNRTVIRNLKAFKSLTLILLAWTIWRAPTNVSKWRMGFNSAFKGLNALPTATEQRRFTRLGEWITVETGVNIAGRRWSVYRGRAERIEGPHGHPPGKWPSTVLPVRPGGVKTVHPPPTVIVTPYIMKSGDHHCHVLPNYRMNVSRAVIFWKFLIHHWCQNPFFH